jgi:hypothetical protein
MTQNIPAISIADFLKCIRGRLDEAAAIAKQLAVMEAFLQTAQIKTSVHFVANHKAIDRCVEVAAWTRENGVCVARTPGGYQ